jgi:hypothetical protein
VPTVVSTLFVAYVAYVAFVANLGLVQVPVGCPPRPRRAATSRMTTTPQSTTFLAR